MGIEEWKPISGYEGLYEVSSYGNVRMLGRLKRHRNGKLMSIMPKVLSQFLCKGYRKVKLRDNKGSAKMVSVHRLVALAFIPNLNGFPQVNHKDENKCNNHISNLEWCTAKYNTNYGTGIERCSIARFKPVIATSPDGHYISAWRSMKDASKDTNVSYSTISQCCNGLQKTGKGLIWNFLYS